MQYGIVCRRAAPAAPLSSQTATATHNSGAGAQNPPGLWKEGGQTEETGHSPTEGSKQPVGRGCGLGLQFLLEAVLRIWERKGKRELFSAEKDEA